jgi:cell division protein DivIC|tara:strand:+ start:1361 stop:1663 length:303 start_codon:yes stop_codon:yes gene_type:complete
MKKNKQILKTIVSKVKNPYLILIFLFVMWMLFFDSNSYLNHLRLSNSINQLEKDKLYYKEEIKKDSIALDELSNPEGLERYAREVYHMKKENEEIFLISE